MDEREHPTKDVLKNRARRHLKELPRGLLQEELWYIGCSCLAVIGVGFYLVIGGGWWLVTAIRSLLSP